MPELEPITREEMLLDGEDLTPITRKEKFIKRIYDKTQEIPEPVTREEMFLKKAGEGSGGDVTIEQLDVSENGTYSESGKAYSPVVVNVPIPTPPDNAYLLEEYGDVPTDIASFTASDAPLKSLTASIVPVQAGSGDPSPTNVRPISGWTGCEVIDDAVYGGFIDWNQLVNVSGFPSGELYGITYVNNDSDFTINGTATSAVYLNIVPNFQNLLNNNHIYLFCPNISDTSQPIAMTDSYNGQIQIKNSAIVKKSSWNTFWLAYYIPNGSTITNVVITPQVYDLTQLFGETKANEIYAMEQAEAGSGVAYFKSLFYKDYYSYNSGEITNVSAVNGDTDKYRKYTIPFTDSQGQSVEVFGGSVDVVNGGEQPRTLGYVDLGTLNWGYNTSGDSPYFFSSEPLPSEYHYIARNPNVMCSNYSYASVGSTGSDIGFMVIETGYVRIRDLAYTDPTAFKTAMSGVQLVYELATPTTFYTQPTSIKSLDGENNVSASTGEIENLEFFTKEA